MISLSTIILLAVPRGNEKKEKNKSKKKRNRNYDYSQNGGPIKVRDHKDGTEGFTHTKQTQSHIIKKGTESDKWRLNLISWVVCVCVCMRVGWSLCSSGEIHQDRPHIHTFTHTLAQTYQKASQGVFLSSVKARILYLGYLWQRNQPPTNHNCSGRSLKLLFSINSVQIIYFIYTLNIFSAETTQNLQTLIDVHLFAVILCSFLSAGSCFLYNFGKQNW